MQIIARSRNVFLGAVTIFLSDVDAITTTKDFSIKITQFGILWTGNKDFSDETVYE